jgi:hypothetical protein
MHFVIKKTTQSKQVPNRRKFAQTGLSDKQLLLWTALLVREPASRLT